MRRVAPLLFLLGCTEPATQLIVSVGTDYEVPAELAWVAAHTERAADGRVSITHEYDLARTGMPFSFGVAPKEGEEDLQIIVVLEGFRALDEEPRVVARARTGFIEKKALNLPMFLAESCGGIWDQCSSAETCVFGTCVADDRPPDQLEVYDPKKDPHIVPPPRQDAGVLPDTGVDAGLDGGVDAGDDAGVNPDADVDGGVLPDSCPLGLGEPATIGAATIGFDPNLELLAADLDGDGVTEFAAARRMPSSSPIAVVDFGNCNEPIVTSSAAHGELRQGILFTDALYAVERRKISSWQYSGPNALSETTVAVARASAIERLTLNLQSATGLAVADVGGWSYVAFSAAGFGALTTAPEQPRGFTAELNDNTYFHGDDLGLRAIMPGAAVTDLVTTPAVLDPILLPSNEGTRLVAARADQLLAIARWNNGPTGSPEMIDFGARIIAGPIPVSRHEDETRLIVLLDNGLLTGCRSDDGGSCNTFSDSRQLPMNEVDDRRSLLTAYIDDDAWPDIVLVTRRGKVFFVSGDDLQRDAAPMIDLALDSNAPPAIAHGFFSAFGLTGSLLAVPHNQRISLVGWSRAGSSIRLWSQHRRDARRSAREP